MKGPYQTVLEPMVINYKKDLTSPPFAIKILTQYLLSAQDLICCLSLQEWQ